MSVPATVAAASGAAGLPHRQGDDRQHEKAQQGTQEGSLSGDSAVQSTGRAACDGQRREPGLGRLADRLAQPRLDPAHEVGAEDPLGHEVQRARASAKVAPGITADRPISTTSESVDRLAAAPGRDRS